MTCMCRLGLGALVLCSLIPAVPTRAQEMPSRLNAVPFQDVHVEDAFWSPRIERNRTVTIEADLRQCERDGHLDNFVFAAGMAPGKHRGLVFNDSDVYKVIEGAAYTLSSRRDPALEKRIDDIIHLIAAAQQPDGYLDTYYTLVEPQNRWKNIKGGHELYCAGHLIEAAVAYRNSTGKRQLLDVACKFADHIDSVFGPDKRHAVSGHPEIELALLKLYHATGEKRYLRLAQFFIDERGHPDGRQLFGEYAQDHKPVREQTEVVGHAVRAMYLYCGMADLAAETGDPQLFQALENIWHDVVDRKMYLTGGIGPSAHN
ncbi:MAG: glycoside hydrolase family 127 protein, partial [Planctomycetes bacterium]|nr:glycoside hydrolase family 127 protein [Planctomycetota bacterium]